MSKHRQPLPTKPKDSYEWARELIKETRPPDKDALGKWIISGRRESGGEKEFYNTTQRQRELVGITLDTALEATLVHYLMLGAHPEALLNLGLIKKEAADYLDAEYFNDLHHHEHPEISEKKALDIMHDFRENHWIARADDFDSPEKRKAYEKEMQTFVQRRDSILESVITAGDGLGTPALIKKEEEFTPPPDPLVIDCLKLCRAHFLFRDTGYKNARSLKQKIEAKNGTGSPDMHHVLASVRDANRITVIPDNPEMERLFCEVLQDRQPQGFMEPAQVTDYGYVDRKAYIPLKAQMTGDEKKGIPKYLPGEIKIEGRQMLEADKLTHSCYKFTKRMCHDTKGEFNPEQLVELYKQGLEDHEPSFVAGLPGQLEDFVRDYKASNLSKTCPTIMAWADSEKSFPDPDSEENKRTTVEALNKIWDEARHLIIQIYKNEMLKGNREWIIYYSEILANKAEIMHEQKTPPTESQRHALSAWEEIISSLDSRIEKTRRRFQDAGQIGINR